MKPIFIIKMPSSVHGTEFGHIRDAIKSVKELKENYIVMIVVSDSNEFQFEAFYPKDFDVKSLDEIKSMVNEKLIAIIE